jgi:hypothetical protein
MDTATWTLLSKSFAYAVPATENIPCSEQDIDLLCTKPNPMAGAFDDQIRLDNPPAASSIEVLYRSAGHTGIRDVAVR